MSVPKNNNNDPDNTPNVENVDNNTAEVKKPRLVIKNPSTDNKPRVTPPNPDNKTRVVTPNPNAGQDNRNRPAGGNTYPPNTQQGSNPANRRFQPPPPKDQHRVNNEIRGVREVRLVGDNVVEEGVFAFTEALKMAEDMELDLVEIAPNAAPPVCRIIDYRKFLYDKKRKEKEIKAKTVKMVVKEVRFTPETDDHDLDFKSKHAERFLEEGAKVKAYVSFKGRGILFKERGELLLLKLADRLKDFGTLEQMPKLEGKRMFVFFSPKKKK